MPTTRAVVMSGKGGSAKSLWIALMAGEASRAGIRTLLIDVDPERNLSNRNGISQHATGLGNVLEDAGVMTTSPAADKGAKRLTAEVAPSLWEHVDLVPAGATLAGVAQVSIDDTWLLRDILDHAGVDDRYELVLLDTGGRTGALATLTMYAADVAFAPVTPTTDAVRKALEARTRVEKIQRAHQLRWAGVVLSGFDLRTGIDYAIREETLAAFGDQVRAEVPRRATVHEAYQVGERLGDRRDVVSSELAGVFRGFLTRDLMGRPGPAGVLR
jgi:chromosome partitioning protein